MGEVAYRCYELGRREDLGQVKRLIEADLSEPYSSFTYHFFLHEQPHLCRLAIVRDVIVGVVVGKISPHQSALRGYIGMLAVDKEYRGRGIGRNLAKQLVERMICEGVDEIVLEAEASNSAALSLYGKLGFVRDKRLAKYYLNGSDAFRLKLWTVP